MWLYNILILIFCSFVIGNDSENILSDIIKRKNDRNSSFNDESLIECIIDLTQITTIYKPTILILESENNDEDDLFFIKIIKRFAERDALITIQGKDIHEVNQTRDVYDRNVIIIVYFETCDALSEFKITDVDKRVKHLIILSRLMEDYLAKLQVFARKYIERDITFIIQDSTAQKFNIIIFPPVIDRYTCEYLDKIEPKKVNTCIDGALETDDVLSPEFKVDLKNCSFRVGMATMFPFSKIPNQDKLKNYDLIDEIQGSDVEIMKIIIGNYFHGTPVWYYIDREEQNPFTKTEFVAFLINGSLHACAGGLYRIYGDLVSYSGIYTRQAVIWIYAADRTSRSWVNLVQKLHGMYLFYLFYIGYSIASYLFRKYDRQSISLNYILLYSCGSLTGGASLPDSKSLKQKILDISYLILCIYLCSYINIQLVNFLTIDGPSITFNTNDEVYNSGRTVYLNRENKWIIQEEKYLAFANTSKDCGGFFDCGKTAVTNDGLTVIVDEYFYTLQAATAVNDEARILRATQNIVTVYQEMLLKKDSPIVVGFQKVLKRLFEAGICEHLYKESIGITVVAKAEIANKNAVSNSHSCQSGCAITLSQVAGVFYVWGIGCFLSVCVFLLEVKSRKQRSDK